MRATPASVEDKSLYDAGGEREGQRTTPEASARVKGRRRRRERGSEDDAGGESAGQRTTPEASQMIARGQGARLGEPPDPGTAAPHRADPDRGRTHTQMRSLPGSDRGGCHSRGQGA